MVDGLDVGILQLEGVEDDAFVSRSNATCAEGHRSEVVDKDMAAIRALQVARVLVITAAQSLEVYTTLRLTTTSKFRLRAVTPSEP